MAAIAGVLSIFALATPASADDRAGGHSAGPGMADHEIARLALLRGEILPLSRILAELANSAQGDVLGIELERRKERWVYEIKLITPQGVLTKMKVDAATGLAIDKVAKDVGPKKGH